MDHYTSSLSNTVDNESDNPPSSFSSPFHIWQQPVLQGDYNLPMIHDPSQSVTPTVPQDHVVQSNVPFPHPSISFYQRPHRQFSFQDDAGPEVHTVPQDLTSAAVSQRQIAYVNASTTPQPPHQIHQDTFPVQGDPSPHVPSNVVSPIQTKTPADQKRHTCPFCKEKFKRNQELKRHLRSNLPDSIHCPFYLCPWTGRRQYSLTNHMKVHSDPDPGRKRGRKESQIYDPGELVRSMANGTLTIEGATNIALSKIRKRFEEKDKAGVEASVWGNRRKFCTARSPS